MYACTIAVSTYLIAITTMPGNCEDGQVRLTEGITDEGNLTMDGRLEICINNAWGTICNNSFRVIDAQVACGQLSGFGTAGLCSYRMMLGNSYVHMCTF